MDSRGFDLAIADMPRANRLTLHVLAAAAEHERHMIGERTRQALAAAKARGTSLAIQIASPQPDRRLLQLETDVLTPEERTYPLGNCSIESDFEAIASFFTVLNFSGSRDHVGRHVSKNDSLSGDERKLLSKSCVVEMKSYFAIVSVAFSDQKVCFMSSRD
jgi:hypothetical protein